MFKEIWPDYEINASGTVPIYFCFPCNHDDFFMSIPEWLCNILGIIKIKNRHYSSCGYKYDVWIPTYLVNSYFDFSNMISCIEDEESVQVLDLKKSNSLAEKKSLDELKDMKKNLERELSILTKAIGIKDKKNSVSKQKTYKK